LSACITPETTPFDRLADEKMNVLRHDDITGCHEAVTLTHPFERILEKIARLRRA
jgi:hypothetical protein